MAQVINTNIASLNAQRNTAMSQASLLVSTLEKLAGRIPAAVIEGDQQTEFDAERIRATGVAALQINTGKGCHLDGHMVGHAIERLAPAEESLFLIENVGNLVCPAMWDLGEAAKVAILSAVETVTSKIRSTIDAAALCKMADRGQITGGLLDGPLAFDNAVSIAAARIKGIVSEVAGQADILVVPDLESGNMLAKQLIFMGGAASAGIVLGAKVPVILTSRADSRDTRIASCAIALMLAHHYRLSPP